MAAKAGGHYGPVFQSHHRVTQGGPLSPTIFKVVIDAVIQHRVKVVGIPQEGTGQGLEASIQNLSALFYADYVLAASPDSARLQGVVLFGRVSLRTNEGNTVSMDCRPCHTPRAWSTEAYTRQVTVRGLSYRERLRQRVHCPECRVNLEAGSITSY